LPLIAINLARKYGFYQILVVILDVIEKNRAKSQNFREKIWIIGNKCLSLHHEMAQPSEGRGEMLNRWNRLLASCTAGLKGRFRNVASLWFSNFATLILETAVMQ